MTEFNQALLISHVYRYLLILAGLIFGYWGYRLFRVGYYERAGELKAAWGEHHLVLKQVAPGVFFALFGAAIITATIARPVRVQRQPAMNIPAASTIPDTRSIVPNASAAQPDQPTIPKTTARPTNPAPTQTPLDAPAQPASASDAGLQVESSKRSAKAKKGMLDASQKRVRVKDAQEPAQDQKQ